MCGGLTNYQFFEENFAPFTVGWRTYKFEQKRLIRTGLGSFEDLGTFHEQQFDLSSNTINRVYKINERCQTTVIISCGEKDEITKAVEADNCDNKLWLTVNCQPGLVRGENSVDYNYDEFKEVQLPLKGRVRKIFSRK